VTKEQAIEIHDSIPTSDAVALRAFLEALAAAGAFPCCGGSDEHPPEHTQDCVLSQARAITEADRGLAGLIARELNTPRGATQDDLDRAVERVADLIAEHRAEAISGLGKPSRPVAIGASEITDDEREALGSALTLLRQAGAKNAYALARSALEKCNAALESRPVAVGSKARAEMIAEKLSADAPDRAPAWYERGAHDLIEALDRAQFFADEATLAEIDRLASEILSSNLPPCHATNVAVALAAAVRKLGIGVSRE
jgi:hypothetical protein